MRWLRIAAIAVTAILGVGGAWAILRSSDAPRWLVAFSGLIGLAGLAAFAALVLISWYVVTEKIRPSLRFRKPVVPLALAHREASLVGRRAYRNHPIRFWGGLILNNSFFVGFMLFGKPECESFKVDEDTLSTPTKEEPNV